MNLVVNFESIAIEEITELREAYLDSLVFAQEMLLEAMISTSECYRIVSKGSAVGYLIVHSGQELVEFYLEPEYWLFGEIVIGRAIVVLQLRSALVKSFDHLFFSSSIGYQKSLQVRGLLVRDYIPRSLPEHPSIAYTSRLARGDDVSRIARVEQDVFTDLTRLEMVVSRQLVRVFDKGRDLVGFGIIRPIFSDRREVDLGIAVDVPFRNKGYAIYMMRDLVVAATEAGFIPVAGCSSSNQASRRMGERVGLVSRFRLLEIEFVEQA